MIWLIAAVVFVIQYVIAARTIFRLYPWSLSYHSEYHTKDEPKGRPSFMVDGKKCVYRYSARERHFQAMLMALIWPFILIAGLVTYNNEPVRARQARIEKEAAAQDLRIAKLERELRISENNSEGEQELTYAEYRARYSGV